jgi:hypothetical protein
LTVCQAPSSVRHMRFVVGRCLDYPRVQHLGKLEGKIETSPVIKSRTISPAFTPLTPTRLCRAVTAAQGRVAASVSLRLDDVESIPFSSRTAYSVNSPPTTPPIALPMTVRVIWRYI